MLPWLFAFSAAIILGLGLIITGRAKPHRDNKRHCPRCAYDLSASPQPPCPECGFEWKTARQLLSRPARRLRIACGALILMATIWAAQPLLWRSHWTNYVPRPVLSLALTIMTPDQTIPAGAKLPTPNRAIMYSSDRWERLMWQTQAARAVDHFMLLVEQSREGSIAEIEVLIPAALEASTVYRQYGGSFSSDAWPMERAKQRARNRAAEIDARCDLPLGTWAAAELQFQFPSGERYPDWIDSPLSIIGPLSRSQNPQVRRYALDRLATNQTTEANIIIEQMAANDPDPSLRKQADQVLQWRRAIRAPR